MKTKKRNQPKTEERPNTAMFRQACSAGDEFAEFFKNGGKFEKCTQKEYEEIINKAQLYKQ